MSRAGVTSDVAERVLGHVIGGVRGIYDRHLYESEKHDALERLAALVGRILQLSAQPGGSDRAPVMAAVGASRPLAPGHTNVGSLTHHAHTGGANASPPRAGAGGNLLPMDPRNG